MKLARIFFLFLVFLAALNLIANAGNQKELIQANTQPGQTQGTSGSHDISRKNLLSGFSFFVGPTLSNLYFAEQKDEELKKKSKFGFLVGIGYELRLPVARRMFLQVNLLLTTGGAIFDYDWAVETLSAQALALPVLLKYKFLPASTPFVFGGFFFGSVLSPKARIEFEDGEIWEDKIESEDIHKLVFGLTIGTGYELWLKNFKLFLEAVFSPGLTDLMKEGNGSARPTSFNLIAGIRF